MSMCSYESYQLCIHSWWIMLCCNCRKLPTTCTTKTTAPNVWPRVAGSKPRLAARPPVCLHLRPLAVQWMKRTSSCRRRRPSCAGCKRWLRPCRSRSSNSPSRVFSHLFPIRRPWISNKEQRDLRQIIFIYLTKIISELNLQTHLCVNLFLNGFEAAFTMIVYFFFFFHSLHYLLCGYFSNTN